VVKKHVNSSMETVTEDIRQVQSLLTESRAQAEEHREKESRRNNLVLYKVPESNADRAEDRNKADIAFCLQLFNNALQMGVAEEDLVHVFRLGRRGDENNENNPRHLMVQLASYTSKNLILESLFKLKHADLKYKRVVVAHDLTRADREECKMLVAHCTGQNYG